MIASIHQPHFMPWTGYFNKVVHSDVFVWLHTVQYRKNYFQNRTQIRNRQPAPMWLTVPVHASSDSSIDTVTIADERWADRVRRTIEHCYKSAPFYDAVGEKLFPAIDSVAGSLSLDDVDFTLFTALLPLLAVAPVRVVRAGTLDAECPDATERLVQMCKGVGATQYIAGKGGRKYLNIERFEAAGIKVLWQAFDPINITYTQAGPDFVHGLSVIDTLFNTGPEVARGLIAGAWEPGC